MKRCIACGAPLWETPLLTLDNMPASAQHMPDAEHVGADKGLTLDLCQCSGCGLVQFDCEPVDYYRDVIRAGGYSTTMAELRRKQYKHLIETYHLEGKRFIEVGCGQGEFLQVLKEFPVEVHGIEHDPALVELAKSKGIDVVQGFTETEDTVFPGGLYDVFLSFNFLEHQPDPVTMLRAIWNNLEDDAMGLITVPSFEYIMEHSSYYELIRDHSTSGRSDSRSAADSVHSRRCSARRAHHRPVRRARRRQAASRSRASARICVSAAETPLAHHESSGSLFPTG